MKLKLLKGVVYNACDRVKSYPFRAKYFTDLELPSKGKWIIDLKNNKSITEKEKTINLPFTSEFHEWFLKELKKADVPITQIEKADLVIEFGHKYPNFCICSFSIIIGSREYKEEVSFYLFD